MNAILVFPAHSCTKPEQASNLSELYALTPGKYSIAVPREIRSCGQELNEFQRRPWKARLSFFIEPSGAETALAIGEENASLAAQSAPSSFSISIKLVGPATKKVGSEVAIGIVLTNTSNEDLHFMHYRPTDLDYTAAELDYTVDVRDSQGQTPKVKEPDNSHGSPFRVRVRPGKTISVAIAADDLYQMNEPGEYTIQLSRSSLEDPQHPVKSNKVTVTITP